MTQCGQDVTAIVTENLHRGQTTVCLMAKRAGVDVIPVDIGVARDVEGDTIRRCKVMYGTNDMTREPAMTREQAYRPSRPVSIWPRNVKIRAMNCCVSGNGIGNTTSTAR